MDEVINALNPIGTILSTLATREQRDLARTLLETKPKRSIRVTDLGGIIAKILLDQDVDGVNALCIRYHLVYWEIIIRAIGIPIATQAAALAVAGKVANDNLAIWVTSYHKLMRHAVTKYLESIE